VISTRPSRASKPATTSLRSRGIDQLHKILEHRGARRTIGMLIRDDACLIDREHRRAARSIVLAMNAGGGQRRV
jgi:hypothetical protein